MNTTSSPIHPDHDMIGQDRASGKTPAASSDKPYPTNPYWQRPQSFPTGVANEPIASPIVAEEMSPVPTSVFDPTHLIGTLTSAIADAGRTQQDQLLRELTNWLPQLPDQLSPTMQQHLDRIVPKVIKVEQPGKTVLRLVRFLTVGMATVGLLAGGLLYAWLQTLQERDSLAPGYWQHRYIMARTVVAHSSDVHLLQEADTLYHSPLFMDELNRLERIIEARQQQYFLRQRERELIQGKPKPRTNHHK